MDVSAPLGTGALNEYLDNIESESSRATKEYRQDWEELIRWYRGLQWQQKLPSHRIPFTANYTNVTVKRLVALMTDTKPTIDVHSRASGLSELTGEVLVPALRALWDEQGCDQRFAGSVLPLSIITGACGVNIGFDPTVGSLGEISINIVDPRSMILDPAVTRTVDLDHAEYSGFQTVVSLSRLRQLFPRAAMDVKPDAQVSRFLDRQQGVGSGIDSPGHRIVAKILRQGATESYAVPRVRVQEFFIRDTRTVKEFPKEFQEHCFERGLTLDDMPWPGGRRIVRAGENKKILYDGPNRYIDGKTPLVMYDWGLETEHPWGASEVKLIKSLQAILNKLGSSIVENAIKMNNNIWIGDRDALEKREWGELNDAPGLLVKVKPGRTLRRESAPALPGSVFQMLQWIVNTIDMLTGLVDVTQGRRPVGVVSSHAIEALNLSAQALIRLQTRKFENFLERVGQRLIARIFQFYTSDRIMHQLGPGGKWREFRFERDKLIKHAALLPDEEGKLVHRPFNYMTDLDLLKFVITPGSSMAITRLQKGQMSMGLYGSGLVPGVQVLRALEWDDPEGTVQQARAEAAAGATSIGNTKRGRIPA